MSTQTIRPSRALNKASMGIRPGLPLEVGGGGVDDLRRAVQVLLDIEGIKQVKHAYFRCVDTHNMDELAELIHEDVDVQFIGGTYEWKLKGRKEYLAAIDKSFHKHAIGHHNGHQPEIQILSATEATGIWYLADNMWILNMDAFTTGTALYWDRYVKADGRWQIRETRYERLYEINQRLTTPPPLGAHYLAFHGS